MSQAQQRKSSFGNRGSNVGAARGAAKEVDPATATTHYAKIKTGNGTEFVDGMQIWENESQFGGTYLKIRVSETLQPGDYFVSAKRAK